VSRLRYNFITGLCNLTGNTLTLASGISVTVTSGSGDYLPIAINPAPFTAAINNTNTEIVWVTAYTAGSTTATVIRGQEGTSALSATIWPIGTPYAHGSTTQDYGLLNQLQNNDFPNPTASGQILVSLAAGSGILPTWDTLSTTVSGYYSGLVVSGNQVYGYLPNSTISGSQVYGYLSNATISGSQVIGVITSISGYYSNLVVSGSQVYGYLSNATISGSQIVGPISTTYYAPTGLTGATAASRYVGATTNGAPITGTFQVGDFIVDQTGNIWICTISGSPGTWTEDSNDLTVDIVMGVYY